MKSLKFSFAILLFLVSFFIFSEDCELIIKIPQKAQANEVGSLFIDWTDRHNYFCVVDGSDCFIGDVGSKKIIRNFRHHKANIFDIDYSKRNSYFITVGEENAVIKWGLDSKKPLGIYPLDSNQKIKSIALSPKNDLIVVGLEKGFISANFNLKSVNSSFDIGFEAHQKEVYSLGFNSDGKYLISVALDGIIKIWDTKEFKEITKFQFYSKNRCPAIFSPVDDVFASCISRTKIHIRDMTGVSVSIIDVGKNIKDFKFTQNAKFLVVLTESDELRFFRTSTGQLEGVIVPCIQSELKDFDISPNGLYLLSIYKNGEIYLTKTESMFLPPEFANIQITKSEEVPTPVIEEPLPEDNDSKTAKAENEESILEDAEEERPSTEEIESSVIEEIEEEGGEEQSKLPEGIKLKDGFSLTYGRKVKDAIELCTSFSMYPNRYYLGTLDFNVGYYFYRWLFPFYFGADASFGTSFPRRDFPQDYYFDQQKLKSPVLMNFGFALPLGFALEPFGNGFRFGTELSAGIRCFRLWNGSSKQAIYGKIFVSPHIAGLIGVGYKWVLFNFGVNYNKILHFNFVAQLVFRIEMDYSVINKKQKQD